MEPIDRPFRIGLHFCIVWAVLAIPAGLLIRSWDEPEPLYCSVAMVILLSFFATFFVYGPVLLARQILASGSRGWYVARVAFTAVLLVAAVSCFICVAGHGKPLPLESGCVATSFAIAYLHIRLKN
jgi:hypothetical protein